MVSHAENMRLQGGCVRFLPSTWDVNLFWRVLSRSGRRHISQHMTQDTSASAPLPFVLLLQGPNAMAAPGQSAAAAAMGDVRLTLQQLAAFDGSDTSKPLYIAVRGKIYDVTAGRSFYGPGVFVG